MDVHISIELVITIGVSIITMIVFYFATIDRLKDRIRKVESKIELLENTINAIKDQSNLVIPGLFELMKQKNGKDG